MAGALNVQLGGPSRYGGIVSEKPTLGEPEEPLTTEKARQAIGLMGVVAALALMVGVALAAGRSWVLESFQSTPEPSLVERFDHVILASRASTFD